MRAVALPIFVVAACALACPGRSPLGRDDERIAQPPACEPSTASGLDALPDGPRCRAPARPPSGASVDLVEPWPNLVVSEPLFLVEEPGTDLIYVIQKNGRIVRFDKHDVDVTMPEVWGDIDDRVASSNLHSPGERGLLGMAFHPRWPVVDEVFFYYIATGDAELFEDRLSRFRLDSDGTLDEDSEEILIQVDDWAQNHNGGAIAFGPDGMLYGMFGDGGGPNDPREYAQQLGSWFGKALRIDVDRRDPGLAYAVPPDNPFVDVSGALPEIWALGFRNPWRWSFDRETGALWAGDVGQRAREEVNIVEKGGNYGWDMREGRACSAEPGDASGPCDTPGLVAPVVDYEHDGVRTAVMGGYVYRGLDVESLRGTYVYADFGSGEIFALFFDEQGAPAPQVIVDSDEHITSFAEDEDGELYALVYDTDRIFKLEPAADVVASDFPQTLTASGCVDENDAKRAAPGLLPYAINHELWSDGASKERYLSLPPGTSGTLGDDGDLAFPEGTVLMKTFLVGGRRVETRLLVHHAADGAVPAGWAGYSYEWNDDESDALLIAPGGKTKSLSTGLTWTFPARNGCLACHTAAAGRVLGLETAQLDRPFLYETESAADAGPDSSAELCANQLDTWSAIGAVSGALPSAAERERARFPAVDDESAADEAVARAYLHVNCATCHRPGGIGAGTSDMRASTALASTALCNARPEEGELGISDARLIVPRDPARSLVSVRMKALDVARMPRLGSRVVDERGVARVDQWIESLLACPAR